MSLHLGVTLGLLGSAAQTVADYREGGMHRVLVSWSGYDPNYGWNPKWIRAPIPLVVGTAATIVAVKTGVNKYTPKGINI